MRKLSANLAGVQFEVHRWAPARVSKLDNHCANLRSRLLIMNIGGTPKLSPKKSLQRQRRAREYTSDDVSSHDLWNLVTEYGLPHLIVQYIYSLRHLSPAESHSQTNLGCN